MQMIFIISIEEVNVVSETISCSLKCSGHGICDGMWNNFHCVCDEGFAGNNCERKYGKSKVVHRQGIYESNQLPSLELIHPYSRLICLGDTQYTAYC